MLGIEPRGNSATRHKVSWEMDVSVDTALVRIPCVLVICRRDKASETLPRGKCGRENSEKL
ncbi:hypothetical protein KSP40_PGU014411 [Platanthera guangdongensis]|uniref:Uncharacterized protein n=1 Tax=Platanthera guangdongensis TaxID=2320717 RepID=A0ABR2LYF4_9ASPA